MRINLSVTYVIGFLLLLIVMLELHEMVHITIGRIICGCWGARDFNVWSLCEQCSNGETFGWIATLSGPLFSFIIMWTGMFWLSSTNSKKKALGFALIFANIPFGRITTVMMNGGDEMVVVRHFLKGSLSTTQLIWIGSVILFLLTAPPVFKAFKTLTNKLAWLYIIGFLTLPLLFLLLYILIALNSLLNMGFLATPWIMGTPILITIHTFIAFVLLLLMRKRLYIN